MAPPLTVIVTGANAGLGLGICERLILQLAQKQPSDVPTSSSVENTPLPCTGLTLIMACRSFQRADASRNSLYKLLDDHIEHVRHLPNYDGHAELFRANLSIEIHTVDLSSMDSIFSFADEIHQKYIRISHMICNAGVASWTHLNWLLCVKQLFLEPYNWISKPNYYVQQVGETTADGLGWVWQANLFGHFALFRLLEPLLTAEGYSFDSRIIWLSSHTAAPSHFNVDDLQLLKNNWSYEAVKYEIDILATHLDELALKKPHTSRRIRHFIAHPNVCSTAIAMKMTGALLDWAKWALFHLARLIGSSLHVISPFLAAMSCVYLVLAPDSSMNTQHAVKYGTRVNRWGTKVWAAHDDILEWPEHRQDAALILEQCDSLLQTFK